MPERRIIWGQRLCRPTGNTNPAWWWCRECGGDIHPGDLAVMGTTAHGHAVPYCQRCHDGIVMETVN